MIKIGNCGNSWGIFREWREMQMPWRRFLDEFQSAGYKYLEMAPYGYLPTDAAILNEEFASRGIVPVAMSIMHPFEQDENMDWAIERTHRICRLMKDTGMKYFVYMDGAYQDPDGNFLRPRSYDMEAWKKFVKNVTTLAKIARDEYGLENVYHHHGGMCIEYDEQIDQFLDSMDSSLMNLLLDTGHYVYRNKDVCKFIRTHSDRIKYVHLKNVNQAVVDEVNEKDLSMSEAIWKHGIFMPIEEGSINFEEVRDALRDVNYDGYAMLECDIRTPDYDSLTPKAIRTRDYLQSINFGSLV